MKKEQNVPKFMEIISSVIGNIPLWCEKCEGIFLQVHLSFDPKVCIFPLTFFL